MAALLQPACCPRGTSPSYAHVCSAGRSWSRLGSVLLPLEPQSALPTCQVHSRAAPGHLDQREGPCPRGDPASPATRCTDTSWGGSRGPGAGSSGPCTGAQARSCGLPHWPPAPRVKGLEPPGEGRAPSGPCPCPSAVSARNPSEVSTSGLPALPGLWMAA